MGVKKDPFLKPKIGGHPIKWALTKFALISHRYYRLFLWKLTPLFSIYAKSAILGLFWSFLMMILDVFNECYKNSHFMSVYSMQISIIKGTWPM
jgi:hypothetical protein